MQLIEKDAVEDYVVVNRKTASGNFFPKYETITVDYGFDKNKLCVRTSYKTDDTTPEIWKIPNGQLDPLARMQQEVFDGSSISANGLAIDADSVNLSLTHNPNLDFDQSPKETSYPTADFDPTDPSGNWSAELHLTEAGNYGLTATAKFANGSIEKNKTNNFSVSNNLATNYVNTEYDAAGFIISRTKANGVTQNFKWDALGNLLSVEERDTTDIVDGYNWQAVYDGFGRRLRVTTTTVPKITNIPNTSSTETIDSYFDPLVEFLEIGIKVNNETTWKIYGPDMNGLYGGLQGIGSNQKAIKRVRHLMYSVKEK